jgi:hypothetical protein
MDIVYAIIILVILMMAYLTIVVPIVAISSGTYLWPMKQPKSNFAGGPPGPTRTRENQVFTI